MFYLHHFWLRSCERALDTIYILNHVLYSVSFHTVMDYATHGDLYTLWLVEGAFSESAARIYSAELAMVIDFLHNAGIVYRDMKVSHFPIFYLTEG